MKYAFEKYSYSIISLFNIIVLIGLAFSVRLIFFGGSLQISWRKDF